MLRALLIAVAFTASVPAWVSAWAQPPPAPGTPPGIPKGWPCIQRYQPAVSAGAFWPHELPENVNWEQAPGIRSLADEITERAVEVEEARGKVGAFLKEQKKDLRKTAGLLVAALYEFSNRKRDRVVAGIARFSERQQMMISRIETQAKKIEDMKAAKDTDSEEYKDVVTRQKWDVRVFDEREALVTSLCEQPVLIEQKFFAVGRDIAAYLEEHGG